MSVHIHRAISHKIAVFIFQDILNYFHSIVRREFKRQCALWIIKVRCGHETNCRKIITRCRINSFLTYLRQPCRGLLWGWLVSEVISWRLMSSRSRVSALRVFSYYNTHIFSVISIFGVQNVAFSRQLSRAYWGSLQWLCIVMKTFGSHNMLGLNGQLK
jgi:hypothetical protein